MKIVAINGSPRKDGNTAKLLKKATEDHKDTDLVYYDLVDMRIKDCIACMHCKKHDECSIKDDMTQIYQDLHECDAMVFASPIYMGAETALLKAMVDRMYALLAPAQGPKRYEPRLAPGKKAVAIFTAGNPQANEVSDLHEGQVLHGHGLAGHLQGPGAHRGRNVPRHRHHGEGGGAEGRGRDQEVHRALSGGWNTTFRAFIAVDVEPQAEPGQVPS